MKDEFVMVRRNVLADACSFDDGIRLGAQHALEALLAKPAEQHQDEPYGCMMYPVGRRDEEFFTFGVPDVSRPDAHGEMWEIIPLYTYVDPGEVARLRAALVETEGSLDDQRRYDTQRHVELGMESMQVIGENTKLRANAGQHKLAMDAACGEIEILRAQLAERDALLADIKLRLNGERWAHERGLIRRMEVLSASAEPAKPSLVECDACPTSSGCVSVCMKAPASAEPSAPKCERCQNHGVIGWQTGQTPEQFDQGDAPCPDCAPVERDGLEGVEGVAKSIGDRIKSRAALERKP